jgi:hypothetical protein
MASELLTTKTLANSSPYSDLLGFIRFISSMEKSMRSQAIHLDQPMLL